MKILIATLTLLSCFASEASQLPLIRTAKLKTVQIDENHFENMLVKSTTVSIDEDNRIVRLVIRGRPYISTMECRLPADGISDVCLKPEAVVTIELPITKELQSRCGSRVVTASRDLRPVDGSFEEIVLTESHLGNNDVRCLARAFPKYPTKVSYSSSYFDRMGGKEVSGTSTFEGEAMQILYHILPITQ
jgi:hypothetical protein